MNRKIVDEIIGWYGAVAIVCAYALLNLGVLSLDSLFYQILNATGAAGIVYASFKKKAYQPGILNLIWTAIAIIAIVTILI